MQRRATAQVRIPRQQRQCFRRVSASAAEGNTLEENKSDKTCTGARRGNASWAATSSQLPLLSSKSVGTERSPNKELILAGEP